MLSVPGRARLDGTAVEGRKRSECRIGRKRRRAKLVSPRMVCVCAARLAGLSDEGS